MNTTLGIHQFQVKKAELFCWFFNKQKPMPSTAYDFCVQNRLKGWHVYNHNLEAFIINKISSFEIFNYGLYLTAFIMNPWIHESWYVCYQSLSLISHLALALRVYLAILIIIMFHHHAALSYFSYWVSLALLLKHQRTHRHHTNTPIHFLPPTTIIAQILLLPKKRK